MFLSIAVALVLGILALAFVLYPLFRQRPVEPASASVASDSATAPVERELAARNALQEVELDFQLGNIAEPDYKTLRERYMRRALASLKSRYEREQELDDEIEKQLRQMKEQGEHDDEA
jgi:flagellar basal body-associated protein FliL